jgi:hypothetical protein
VATRFRVIEVASVQRKGGCDAAGVRMGSGVRCPWRGLLALALAHVAAAALLALIGPMMRAAFSSSAPRADDDTVQLLSLSTLALIALSAGVLLFALQLGGCCRGRRSAAAMPAGCDSDDDDDDSSVTQELLHEESVLLLPGIGLQLEEGQARPATRTSSAGQASSMSASSESDNGTSNKGNGAPDANVSSLVTEAGPGSPLCVWRRTRRFIDEARLRGAFINEGVQGGIYIFYLLLTVAADNESLAHAEGSRRTAASASASSAIAASGSHLAGQHIVLPFAQLQPRLALLIPILEGLQDMLQQRKRHQ